MCCIMFCLRSPSGRRDVEIRRRGGNFGRACRGAESLLRVGAQATAVTQGGGDSPPIPGSGRALAAHSSCLHEANTAKTDVECHFRGLESACGESTKSS
ncbi:hypothetical protein GBAR_LOCUS18853 [Geodia barretti]|uniref:Uncharacterized protein n=1 Tax=Geodia barretti TaxID=519541 RepID=A0AA35SNM7_GEOBA|nr:hypothetical protein GBAR_LOCUS18853 [Geodia barretti]